jgi:uncharacterized protein (TIGR01777 family)
MKVLLTGGTGFIGSALCRRWQAEHQITVLSRRPERVARLCGHAVKAISRIDQLSAGQNFDVVVNLAGEPIADRRWSDKRKRLLRESRIGVTADLLSFFERAEKKPELLINASAIGFYGDRGDHILDEEAEAANDFAHQLCRDWEGEASRAADYGVRVCIMRLGLVVAAGGGFLGRMVLPFKCGLGGRIGSGEQWMSWVHRDDVLALMDYLVTHQVLSGVFNATAPQPVTNTKFTQCLARQLRRSAFLPVPAWSLKLLMGEMSGLLLGGQRVMPSRAQQAGFDFQFKCLDKALADALS